MINWLTRLATLVMFVSPGVALGADNGGDAHSRIARILQSELVGHATYDGHEVVGVSQDGTCITILATTAGTYRFDWSQISDPTFLRRNGETDVELQHDTSVGHLITSLPVQRIEMPMTVLYGDCQPK